MAQNKTWCLLLVAIQLGCVLIPSNAFHMFGGGGGGDGSDVAEILAAGLITRMLMEDFGGIGGGGGGGGSSGRSSMFQTLRHQVTSRFNLGAPRHHHHPMPPAHPMQPTMHQHMVAPRPAYQPMMAPSRPMMHPFPLPLPPHILHRHHQYMMNQAMMQQAHQQALRAAWNNEYRALHGSESFVRAYLPVFPTFDELLSDEDTLSAVTILLNSDLLDTEEEEQEEVVQAKEEEVPQPKQEGPEEPEFETASSNDNETRYILPRIVRHFVERIMRRVEHHQ